ncbi:MAG: DegT/DnrJ/EryC1/StrS family aminotransferase [Dehalococcoidia bacterium]
MLHDLDTLKSKPRREALLPFYRPSIDEAEVAAVTEVLKSGWLTTGPKVAAFEKAFAEYVDANHAVAVSSCTAGMHLALECVGIGPGDEVLVPTMTFAATAEVVIHAGATPILVDCRLDDLTMEPDAAEALLRDRTHRGKIKAIMPVHIGGYPCEMEPILALAESYGLHVIEDAAHALPARYNGRLIGGIGHLTAFSFDAVKSITTGEGGMVTTSEEPHAERLRLLRNHGIDRDSWNRYGDRSSWHYQVMEAGYKYNLSDIAAAIGIEQLKKSRRFYEARREYAELYSRAFKDMPELTVSAPRAYQEVSWYLYIIKLNLERLRITRDEFVRQLREENIQASVHFIPLHLQPLYRLSYGYTLEDCPAASTLAQRIVSLPLYAALKPSDIEDVIIAVKKIIEANRR